MESELDFHFSEWCFLAQVDPDAFERRRLRLIEEFLDRSGHHRPRLESLQAAIDKDRNEADSPVEALLTISRKMCGALWLLEEELKELSADLHRLEPLARREPHIWFRSRVKHSGYARPARCRQASRSH